MKKKSILIITLALQVLLIGAQSSDQLRDSTSSHPEVDAFLLGYFQDYSKVNLELLLINRYISYCQEDSIVTGRALKLYYVPEWNADTVGFIDILEPRKPSLSGYLQFMQDTYWFPDSSSLPEPVVE